MIIYDLKCSQGHRFEGWFKNLKDLNGQLKRKQLVCPVCGDEDIVKRPSTFSVVKTGGVQNPDHNHRPPMAKPAAQQIELRDLVKELEKFSSQLEHNFADVGSGFADEALKMHYGVTPKRNIRGVSTQDQEETLRKEGVEFHKVPMFVKKNQASEDKN